MHQQLLIHEDIPYTPHNSAACVILDLPDPSGKETIVETAMAHIERFSLKGSDPGLCVASEDDPSIGRLIDFSPTCTRQIVTQRDALEAHPRRIFPLTVERTMGSSGRRRRLV